MAAIGKTFMFLVGLVLMFYGIMYSGFVLNQFWAWFMVPLGVPALVNSWHAVGLSCLMSWPLLSISMKLEDLAEKEKDANRDWLEKFYLRLAMVALLVTIMWGFGYVYHQLMIGAW